MSASNRKEKIFYNHNTMVKINIEKDISNNSNNNNNIYNKERINKEI
jgi:hypothetical protein